MSDSKLSDGDPADEEQAIAAVRQETEGAPPAVSAPLKLGCHVLQGLLIVIALIILIVGGFCAYVFFQMSQEGHH